MYIRVLCVRVGTVVKLCTLVCMEVHCGVLVCVHLCIGVHTCIVMYTGGYLAKNQPKSANNIK